MRANRLTRYFGLVGAVTLLAAACAPAAPAAPTAAPAKPAATAAPAKQEAKPAAPAKEAAKPAAPAKQEAKTATITPVTIRAVSSWETNIGYAAPLNMFIERIKQKSNGAMTITFAGPEVVPAFENMTAVSNGVYDMSHTTPAFYATNVPEGNALQFLVGNGACGKARETGFMDLINQVHLQRTNAFVLSCSGGGHGFVFLTQEPVQNLEYFRGKKFRTTGLYTPILNALGASPVEIPPADVYTALERRVADGIAWPEMGVIERKVHEVLKYMVKPTWLEVRETFIFNQAAWNRLTPDQQKLLQETAWEMETEFEDHFRKAAEAEQAELQRQGMQIVELPAAEGEKLQTLVADAVWGQIKRDSPEWGPRLQEAYNKYKS